MTALVTGLNAGVDTITYSFTNSCGNAVAAYPVSIITCDTVSRVNTVNVLPKGEIILIPNPATDEITIENLPSLNCKAVVYDVTGKAIPVGEMKSSGSRVVLNIATLVSGIYLVEITDETSIKTIKKLIKE